MLLPLTGILCTIFSTLPFIDCQLPSQNPELKAQIEQSYQISENWFITQLRKKGLFYYHYNPKTKKYSNKNNAIRQLMASRLLAELSQENKSLLPLHRKNLDFLVNNWLRSDNQISYIFYNEKSKLGANAMMLRTLVYSPDFNTHSQTAQKLANGILTLIQPDGTLKPFLKEPDYQYNSDYLMTFYSGEALLSFFEYGQKTNNQEILNIAIKSQDAYIEKYVTNLETNYYPAYVPWHTQSLYQAYQQTKDQKYADAIYTLNNKLLEIQDTSKYMGRFYNPATPQYGTPHSSSDGVYTEGLAYAYTLALEQNNEELIKKYENALQLALKNLSSLQYKNTDPKISGSIRISATSQNIRIDTTQHTMDAYRQLLKVLK